MRIALLLLVCLLAGCHGFTRTHYVEPPSTDPTYELSQNPAILLNAPQDWARMSMHGVHLGDSPASINPNLIRERNPEWIIFQDTNKIRVGTDGKVAALGVWNQKTLADLGITSKDDLIKKLGQPEHTILLSNSTIYLYQDAHIHVIWRALEGKIIGLNVTK